MSETPYCCHGAGPRCPLPVTVVIVDRKSGRPAYDSATHSCAVHAEDMGAFEVGFECAPISQERELLLGEQYAEIHRIEDLLAVAGGKR